MNLRKTALGLAMASALGLPMVAGAVITIDGITVSLGLYLDARPLGRRRFQRCWQWQRFS